MPVAAPLIHLNGSGKENLQRDWREAYTALKQAEEAMSRTCPHMRDYYPMENGEQVYALARDKHRQLLSQINQMLMHYEELYHSTLD